MKTIEELELERQQLKDAIETLRLCDTSRYALFLLIAIVYLSLAFRGYEIYDNGTVDDVYLLWMVWYIYHVPVMALLLFERWQINRMAQRFDTRSRRWPSLILVPLVPVVWGAFFRVHQRNNRYLSNKLKLQWTRNGIKRARLRNEYP